MTNYFYDAKTHEFLYAAPAQIDPCTGEPLPALFAAHAAPPKTEAKQAAVWNGTAWEIIEDHRQHVNAQGNFDDGTPYWLPEEGDTCQSPARYMTELGPIPAGAVTMPPEKPAPTLEEAKATAIAQIDSETSAAILAGFDYEVDGETLHFSYGAFDQQNFADTANVAMLAAQGSAREMPTQVTWNAYRENGELVRLNLDAKAFLALYTKGALTHKSVKMEEGGAKKAKVEAAGTVEEVAAVMEGREQ